MATPERLRSDAGRGKIATIAGVVLMLIASLVAFSPIADAATTATFDSTIYYKKVSGPYNGGSLSNQVAGLMRVTLTGGQKAYVYCIDIHHSIGNGNSLPEVDWATSRINNLNIITGILHTYDALNGSKGPEHFKLVGDENERAAGIQAAIWHYSDGFSLTSWESQNVKTNYDTILGAVNANAIISGNEPAPSLSIDPTSGSGYVGDLVGPFTIATTGLSVTLSASGASIVDAGGATFSGPYSDSTSFYLKRNGSGAGQASVTASTSATIHSGRVFALFGQDNKPKYQRLIMAENATGRSTATATANWTEPPVPVGSLKVTKIVDGTVDNQGGDVTARTFTIEVTDSDNNVVGSGEIKHNESFQINDLAPGKYTVTETQNGGNGVTVSYEPSQTIQVNDGQISEVTVKNSYPAPLGSLKITKTVIGEYDTEGSPVADQSFNVTVTGPNNYSKTGTVKEGSPLVLTGLQIGTYTVVENGAGGGVTTTYVPSGGTVEVLQNQQSEVAITNSYPTPAGSLRIIKAVVGKDEFGNSLDNRKFEVQISGPHNYSKTVEVSAASAVVLSDLVSGTYTVKETDPQDGSSVSYSSADGIVLVSQNAGGEVTITNTYPAPKGELEIIKVINGTVDANDRPITVETEFEVRVTGPHGFDETVTVSAASSATLTNLVSGQYTVSEVDPGGGAVATYSPSSSVTINQTAKATVTVTNTYDAPIGSLSVTKVVAGPGGKGPFTVNVYGPITEGDEDDSLVETVELGAGETKTISGLTPGTYRVEEESPGVGVAVSYSEVDGVVNVVRNETTELVVTNTYPEAPTTTVPEPTTTTTVPESTTTTIEEVGGIDEENTTTTAPEVKDQQVTPTTVGRRLPRTGSNSTTTLSLAGVLMTAGAALVVYGRRRQTA
ncbi:MAG: DUF5979 domain-containing protein [Acidimicrobiia bacterium]